MMQISLIVKWPKRKNRGSETKLRASQVLFTWSSL